MITIDLQNLPSNYLMAIFFRIFILFILVMPLTTKAAYYRWTDSKGVTHYSNSVPPSDAQLGHAELNKNGIMRKIVISSKEKRELLLKEKRQKELNKQKEKARKEKAKQEEEEIRLLSIFSSEDEVTKAYNSKLRMAQLTIDLLKTRHKKQSKKLEHLEQQKERSKNVKHKQLLDKQIEVALDNLSIYQQAITENLVEKDRVRKEYKTTLSRFQNLMVKQALKESSKE